MTMKNVNLKSHFEDAEISFYSHIQIVVCVVGNLEKLENWQPVAQHGVQYIHFKVYT